jgi:hypothetical protein
VIWQGSPNTCRRLCLIAIRSDMRGKGFPMARNMRRNSSEVVGGHYIDRCTRSRAHLCGLEKYVLPLGIRSRVYLDSDPRNGRGRCSPFIPRPGPTRFRRAATCHRPSSTHFNPATNSSVSAANTRSPNRVHWRAKFFYYQRPRRSTKLPPTLRRLKAI